MFLSFKQHFSTSEVAVNYGLNSTQIISNHKSEHADELIEGIHYFYEINPKFKTKVIKWTLEGVYMLGFFIKSKQAKAYRKKVAGFLRAVDEAQRAKYKQTEEQNLNLINQLADCQAFIIKERKHQKDQINGYRSQIAQHNAVIASQRTQLATLQAKCEALEVEVIEAKEHSNESLLKYTRQERDHYRKRCNELLAQKNEFSHYLKNVKEFNARLECLIDGFLNEAIYAQIKNQSVVSEIKKHFFANFRGNAPHICYGLAYGTEIN